MTTAHFLLGRVRGELFNRFNTLVWGKRLKYVIFQYICLRQQSVRRLIFLSHKKVSLTYMVDCTYTHSVQYIFYHKQGGWIIYFVESFSISIDMIISEILLLSIQMNILTLYNNCYVILTTYVCSRENTFSLEIKIWHNNVPFPQMRPKLYKKQNEKNIINQQNQKKTNPKTKNINLLFFQRSDQKEFSSTLHK